MAKRNVDVIVRARDQASKKFGLIGRSALSMGGLIRRAAGIAAVYFGGRAMIRQIGQSLELYGRQEMALRKVAAALELVGKEAETAEMGKFAKEIQSVTTIGDEAVLEMMAMGSAMGKLSGQQLKDATKAAIGLSRAYGLDVTAAMRLVARARVGDTTTLARYGIKLKEGLSTQEKFNQVMEIGARNFSLAEAETETYAGKVLQMKNAVGDLKESIGRGLMPVAMASVERIKEWAETHQEQIYQTTAKVVSYLQLGKDAFAEFVKFLQGDFQEGSQWAMMAFLEMLKATMISSGHIMETGGGLMMRSFGKKLPPLGAIGLASRLYTKYGPDPWAGLSGKLEDAWQEAMDNIAANTPKDLSIGIQKAYEKHLARLKEIRGGVPVPTAGGLPQPPGGGGGLGGITARRGGGGFGSFEVGRFGIWRPGMDPRLRIASEQLVQSRRQTSRLDQVAAGVQRMITEINLLQRGLAPLKATSF